MRCYHPAPDWTWEQWQGRGTTHPPKSHGLAIRLFSVIYRTFIVVVLTLCREAVGVFYSSSRLGNKACGSNTHLVFLYISKFFVTTEPFFHSFYFISYFLQSFSHLLGLPLFFSFSLSFFLIPLLGVCSWCNG